MQYINILWLKKNPQSTKTQQKHIKQKKKNIPKDKEHNPKIKLKENF